MLELKYSNKPPEIYARLKERFGVSFDDGIIIADGYTICCKYEVPPEKIVHELVHSKRQEEMGKDLWWDLYLSKDSFRLEEEILAYREEYKFICQNILDRNDRFKFLHDMARTMSASQYGNICSYSDAIQLIQNKNGK